MGVLNGFDRHDVSPLRYWVHAILPLVYDDSLSYYEVLAKVSAKMNEVIEGLNANNEQVEKVTQFTIEQVKNLTEAFNNFQASMLERQEQFETKILDEQSSFETQLKGDIADWEATTEEKFQQQYEDFEQTETEARNAFEKKITDQQSEYETKLSQKEQQFEDALTQRQETYETSLSQKESQFEEKITTQQSTFEQSETVARTAFETKITEQQTAYEQKETKARTDFEEEMRTAQSDYESSVDSKFSELSTKLDGDIEAWETATKQELQADIEQWKTTTQGALEDMIPSVVQVTGQSTEDVMSQKAVTDALNDKQVAGDYVEQSQVVQETGASTENVMSQKAVTDALNDKQASGDYVEKSQIVQSTGTSETDIMSQKAVTDAIKNASPEGGLTQDNVVQVTGTSETDVMSQKGATQAFTHISEITLDSTDIPDLNGVGASAPTQIVGPGKVLYLNGTLYQLSQLDQIANHPEQIKDFSGMFYFSAYRAADNSVIHTVQFIIDPNAGDVYFRSYYPAKWSEWKLLTYEGGGDETYLTRYDVADIDEFLRVVETYTVPSYSSVLNRFPLLSLDTPIFENNDFNSLEASPGFKLSTNGTWYKLSDINTMLNRPPRINEGVLDPDIEYTGPFYFAMWENSMILGVQMVIDAFNSSVHIRTKKDANNWAPWKLLTVDPFILDTINFEDPKSTNVPSEKSIVNTLKSYAKTADVENLAPIALNINDFDTQPLNGKWYTVTGDTLVQHAPPTFLVAHTAAYIGTSSADFAMQMCIMNTPVTNVQVVFTRIRLGNADTPWGEWQQVGGSSTRSVMSHSTSSLLITNTNYNNANDLPLDGTPYMLVVSEPDLNMSNYPITKAKNILFYIGYNYEYETQNNKAYYQLQILIVAWSDLHDPKLTLVTNVPQCFVRIKAGKTVSGWGQWYNINPATLYAPLTFNLKSPAAIPIMPWKLDITCTEDDSGNKPSFSGQYELFDRIYVGTTYVSTTLSDNTDRTTETFDVKNNYYTDTNPHVIYLTVDVNGSHKLRLVPVTTQKNTDWASYPIAILHKSQQWTTVWTAPNVTVVFTAHHS